MPIRLTNASEPERSQMMAEIAYLLGLFLSLVVSATILRLFQKSDSNVPISPNQSQPWVIVTGSRLSLAIGIAVTVACTAAWFVELNSYEYYRKFIIFFKNWHMFIFSIFAFLGLLLGLV